MLKCFGGKVNLIIHLQAVLVNHLGPLKAGKERELSAL